MTDQQMPARYTHVYDGLEKLLANDHTANTAS